jgi:large proline-rich protein BAG6
MKNIFKHFFFSPQKSPQRPYSETYISGMSSKRRKILQSKKPSANVQQLVADGVRQVVRASSSSSSSARNPPQVDEIVSAIANDSAILNAYRDEVKTNVSQRLKNDPDYDADKYPNSSKAFK